MIIPDVNLLLYAYNSSSAHHEAAKRWLEDLVGGEELIGFAPVVLFGFVRLATSSRAFPEPMTVAKAAAQVRSWLNRSNAQLLPADGEHVEQTLSLLDQIGAGGNLTTDAQIAALALANDAVVHTADADFARFPGLRWVNPITGAKARNPG